MTLITITPPAIEPISLAEAKAHCRIEHADEDALISALIVAARQQCEEITSRALISQAMESRLAQWPRVSVRLPRQPIQSITSVTYIDETGADQVLNSSVYRLTGWESAEFRLAHNQAWPAVRGDVDGIRIRYVAGYGDNMGDIPEPMRSWMLVRIATLYEYRESIVQGSGAVAATEIPGRFVDGLLDSYRVYNF